jgi:MSHA biogenesis protein MshO
MRQTTSKQSGFTLVEAIMAIVLIGIIGSFLAVFIQGPILSYRDSRGRAELTDAADNALRFMARDIRLALPNSLRVSGSTNLNFLLTKTAGRYLRAEDTTDPVAHPPLDFLTPANVSFTAIGAAPTGRQAIQQGDRIVVNNLGPGYQPGDAQDIASGRVNATVQSVTTGDANSYRITLATNPFATQDPPIPDPGARFFVVTGAVSYICTPSAAGTGTLRRFLIGESIVQPTAAALGSGGIVLLDNVVTCNFQYDPVNARMSMLSLSVTLRGKNVEEEITLTHQVHF